MYVSYNWLKELVDFDYSPDELAEILTMLGIEVEEIIDYYDKFKGFIVSKVTKVEKVPNSDKLTLCSVFDGIKKRNIICGAPNVAVNQKVVLGLPGAIVPKANFRIEVKRIHSVLSEGMICSESELGLGDDHSGILVLPDDAPVGYNFAKYLNIDDYIFDISITPNRADCLSHIGIAREIEAYSQYSGNKSNRLNSRNKIEKLNDLEQNFDSIKKRNEPSLDSSFSISLKHFNALMHGSTESGAEISSDIQNSRLQSDNDNPIDVIIENLEKCPRYTARIIRNVKIIESPAWLKYRLVLLGFRPINAVVDVTNYIMLELGQPLHAFDLDKIKGNKIIVKCANSEDKFITLDSKERILDGEMLMICDAERPVAIGGVMGGEDSEITGATKDVLIESACFHPSSIRRTSKKLNISSESSYRFERGVDIDNVPLASERASNLICKLTGGILDGGLIDIYPKRFEQRFIKLRYDRANKIIGKVIDSSHIKEICSLLNIVPVVERVDEILLQVPSYRSDLTSEIDIIEEVARLYNYDNIESDFTSFISFSGEQMPEYLTMPDLRVKLRRLFVMNGFSEILTQNIVSPKSSAIVGQQMIKIANPLGEDLSVMRLSLIPSMLETIAHNIRQGNNDLRLFEIGKTFHLTENTYVITNSQSAKRGKDNTKHEMNYKEFIKGIKENDELILAITGAEKPLNWEQKQENVNFYTIRGIFETAFLKYMKLQNNISLIQNNEKHYAYSGNKLNIILNDEYIGTLGEISPELLKSYHIEQPVFMITLNLDELFRMRAIQPKYEKVSPYPVISRDLAFIVDKEVNHQTLSEEILKCGGQFLKNAQVFDVYSGSNLTQGKKSIAFNLTFSSSERTLTDDEVTESINSIVNSIEKKLNARLRKF